MARGKKNQAAPAPQELPPGRVEALTTRPGFAGGGMQAIAEDPTQLAAIARERYEIEALVATAMMHPRDELACVERIVRAALRPIFAADAEYSFPRGWQEDAVSGERRRNFVTGVSVYAAKPLATYWKNMRTGWSIVRLDDEGFHVRGFGHDLENGRHATKEASGKWMHQRKNKATGLTEWVRVTDERERREIIGKAGSIVERNAILDVIPPDVVEEFVQACRKTNEAASDEKLAKDRPGTIKGLLDGFAVLKVDKKTLEKWLHHPIDGLSGRELAELRGIYRGITKEGQDPSTYFEIEPQKGRPEANRIDLDKAKKGEPQDPKGGATIGKDKPAPETVAPLTEEEMRANDARLDEPGSRG